MIRRYSSTATAVEVTVITYAAFGVLFPLARRWIGIGSKQGEVILFFTTMGIVLIGWLAFCSMRKMRPEPMAEMNAGKAGMSGSADWPIALIAIYVAAMWWGAGSSRVPADLFNGHKEFGLHLDAMTRMNHGAYPWFDFAYPYGLYPITAAWLLWQPMRNSGALVYAGIFLNICAIVLFCAAIRRLAGAAYARFGYVWLLAYLSNAMIFSVYQGLQANWLRYLSPLLVIIAWPAAEKPEPSRIMLFGLATGLVFFIAPELSPFVAAVMILALLCLRREKIARGTVWYTIGLIGSCLPALALWNDAHLPNIRTILGNVFYQSSFILQRGKLSHGMPDLLSLIADLRPDSSAMHALLALYFGLLFYLPMAIVLWSAGWLWLHRTEKTRRWNIACAMTMAIFVVFFKALGASGLGYALLTTPLIIVLMGLFLDDRPAPWHLTATFSFIVLSVAGYGIQQQIFPCLFGKDGYACRYMQRKEGVSKREIAVSGGNSLQKFYADDAADFETLIEFLRSMPGKVAVLSDFTSLYYYVDQEPPGPIPLPSLYVPNTDRHEIEALTAEAAAVIMPGEGYNFVDNMKVVFPEIADEVKRDFAYVGSCGEQYVYLRKTVLKTAGGHDGRLCEQSTNNSVIVDEVLSEGK